MKDQLVKVFKEKFGSEGDIRSYFAGQNTSMYRQRRKRGGNLSEKSL